VGVARLLRLRGGIGAAGVRAAAPPPLPELDGLPLRPAAAAVGEVLAMGDQTLVQVAGEQQVAVGAGVVAEEVAGMQTWRLQL